MTEAKLPKGRTIQIADGTFSHECGFTTSDGWAAVTCEWEDNAIRGGEGAWVATSYAQMWCMGIGATPMDAMADLARSLCALTDVLLRREVELHKAIHNNPEALAREIASAETDLHLVQHILCNEMPGVSREGEDDAVSRALRPLWRAERVLEAFAARLTVPAEQPETS